jgi:polar amino acid transport system substrate-binding protein
MRSADQEVAELVAAGQIRAALFLPQYAKDPASGALQGIGTGFIAIEMIGALAQRLGIDARWMEYMSPAAAIAGLKGRACDVAYLGIEPSRIAELDFSPPIFQFDYTFLVPANSSIHSASDVDRPGVRIAVVDSHASALALRRIVRRAQLLDFELPDAAFDYFRSGGADAFALPRDHLLDCCARLPGSRVLSDRYGINRVGIAMAKGRAGLLAYLSRLAEEAKASGFVQRVIEHGALRGFDVSPRETRS